MFSQHISSLSYSGGAILFSVLFLVSLYTLHKRQTHFILSIAVLGNALFNFFVSYAYTNPKYLQYIPLLEIFKNGAWFAAILSSLKVGSSIPIPKRFYWLIHGLWLALLTLNLLLFSKSQSLDLSTNPIYIWNGLLLAILGLVSVEQLDRKSVV